MATFGHHFETLHNPFADLQRELNQLFDTLAPRGVAFARGLISRAAPPVNVFDDQDALFIECEIPGVDQETLDVSVTGDVLTIKGQRPAIEPREGTTAHIQERGYGAFSRAIALPVAVASDRTEARYENGILTVKLPKAPEAKPKQVNVNIG